MHVARPWVTLGSLIAVLASGCNSDDNDHGARRGLGTTSAPITAPPLVLGPQVFLVPAASGAQVQSDRVVIAAPVALIAGAPGAAGKTAGDLAVGDFLINDYGAPGFVRAVTAVSTTDGTTTALTRLAGLDEVLQTGGVAETVSNLASGGATARVAPDATLPPVDIQFTPLSIALGNNVTVTVQPGSHLAFDPDLDLGLTLGLFSVSEFHAILHGALTGRLELLIHATAAQAQLSSPEIQIFQAPDIDVPLPPTPLMLTARLRVFVGCSVQADASVDVDTGFTLSGTLTAGGHFSNGAWGADTGLPSFLPINPAFGAGASLHASCELRPRLELLLEGLVGPFVDVVPSVYGDLAFHAPPPAITWEVGWTLTGQLGGTLDVLFHRFTLGPVTIFDIGKQRLAGQTTQLASGYCNGNADCPSGQTCSGHACIAPPPPPPDNCAHALDGVYCGLSTMDGFSGHGDAHTIYDCSAHRTTGTSHCSTTCVIAPSGQADHCADNCASALDGVYCGYSTMDGFSGLGDPHTLYDCSRHVTTGTSRCANGCKIAQSGADTCCANGGPVCGNTCCAAGAWCGASNRCCTGCGPGCPC